MLTGDMLGVSTGDLWQHDVCTFMVPSVVLSNLALHIVVRQHRVIQGDTRLRGMPVLTLSFVLELSATVVLVAIGIASTVDIDDALVAAAARLACDLKNTGVRSRLDRGLAESTCKFLLLALAAVRVLRVLRGRVVEHARVACKSAVHRALAGSAKALPAVALVCTLGLVVLAQIRLLGDLADLVRVHIATLITGTSANTTHQILLKARILARSLLLKPVADASRSIPLQRDHTGTPMQPARRTICLLATCAAVGVGSRDLFEALAGAAGDLGQ